MIIFINKYLKFMFFFKFHITLQWKILRKGFPLQELELRVFSIHVTSKKNCRHT